MAGNGLGFSPKAVLLTSSPGVSGSGDGIAAGGPLESLLRINAPEGLRGAEWDKERS